MARQRTTPDAGSEPARRDEAGAGEPALADFYELPVIYDVLHASGTAREIDILERLAARHAWGGPITRWLEPACGTARYLRVLASRGRQAVGVDLSEAMIAYAARRGRSLAPAARRRYRCVVGDITDLSCIEPCAPFDAAFTPINSLRHLPTDAAMASHLREVCRLLRPGGVYIVGMSSSLYGAESPSEDVWEGRRGSLHVKQVVQYEPPTARRGAGARIERAYSDIAVFTPRGERHVAVSYGLRCYSLSQWREHVIGAGFDIAATADQDGCAIDAPLLGYALWVLRRPGRGITRSTRRG